MYNNVFASSNQSPYFGFMLHNPLLRILFLASLLSFSFGTYAQFPELNFERIGTESGLSHKTVTGVLRDREGFLWLATIEGLNRYDGYSCRVFKHNLSDSSSIGGNFLHSLYEDSKGNLWVSTRGAGLNRFNKRTEIFHRYVQRSGDTLGLSSNVVYGVTEDHDGMIWIATEKGLDLHNPATGEIRHFRHNPKKTGTLPDNWINALMVDATNRLWIATLHGLYYYDRQRDHFIHTPLQAAAGEAPISNYIITATLDDQGVFWVTTKEGGLFAYDPKSTQTVDYRPMLRQSLGRLPVSVVLCIAFDDDFMLISTEGEGLLLLHKSSGRFKAYTHQVENTRSLSSNLVNQIYRDSQGIFWVCTWGGGLNKLQVPTLNFKWYDPAKWNPERNNANSVFAIAEDAKGNLWLGTKTHYLIQHNRITGETQYHNLGASITGITVLYIDGRANLWIGCNGLLKWNLTTGEKKWYRWDRNNPQSLADNDIKCIREDRTGTIWIGTENRGASRFNPKTETWQHYFSSADKPLLVRHWMEDQEGNYWFGTYQEGLIILTNQGDTLRFRHDADDPTSISNNDVRQILQTSDGQIWIATYGGGINRWVAEKQHFERWQQAQGLSNNYTYGMLEDTNGDLWISTNLGISRFQIQERKFTIYTEKDGLQNNEFNTGAYYKNADGEMFFGGISGVNAFVPAEIRSSNYQPAVYLSSFKVMEKEVKTDTTIAFLQQVEIDYADKFISFEFTSLDLVNPLAIQYRYRLKGFDTDWIEAGQRRYASYTNLTPGNYIFEVMATNHDGVWNGQSQELKLRVLPPFWLTWWFLLGSATLLVSSLILLVRYISTRKLKAQIKELEKEQAIQHERERISSDLHDHVGAQLTSIISGLQMTETVSQIKPNPQLKQLVESLKEDAQITITHLRDTIWTLKEEKISPHEFADHIQKFAESALRYKPQIEFIINVAAPNWPALQPEVALNLTRVVEEAIHNIIKHAEATKIEVQIQEQHQLLQIVITDNGCGFSINPSLGQEHYGLVNMQRRVEASGGQFQLHSEVGNGTRINIELKA